jgi:hypothetical protein
MATPPVGTATTTVFYPQGDGVTYSCTGGPPFVVDAHSAQANCALRQTGEPPSGLLCDVVVPITFVHDARSDMENGKLCR